MSKGTFRLKIEVVSKKWLKKTLSIEREVLTIESVFVFFSQILQSKCDNSQKNHTYIQSENTIISQVENIGKKWYFATEEI